MSSSSISKSCPAAVNASLASAMDITAHPCPSCSLGSFAGGGPVEDARRGSTRAPPRIRGCPAGPGGRPSSPGTLCRRRGASAGKLLQGRHIDRAVVEEVLDLGELRRQETAVGADGVAGQGDLASLGDVRLQEGQGLAPASARLRADASMAASSPERVCMVRTKSSMSASCAGVACTTRSGPSSTSSRSSSVTRQAISTMVWRAGSAPSSRDRSRPAPRHATGRAQGGKLGPSL